MTTAFETVIILKIRKSSTLPKPKRFMNKISQSITIIAMYNVEEFLFWLRMPLELLQGVTEVGFDGGGTINRGTISTPAQGCRAFFLQKPGKFRSCAASYSDVII